MKHFEVEIQGVTDYMQNRFVDVGVLEKIKETSVGGDPTDDGIVWIHKAYQVEGTEDKFYIPEEHLMGAMIEAGKHFKQGRKSMTYLVAGMFRLKREQVTDFDYEELVCDVRTGKNPNSKGNTVLIKRPRFNNWGAKFVLIVEEEDIKAPIVKKILERAGKYIGIGDYRPMKKGRFGKFEVTKFKEVKPTC